MGVSVTHEPGSNPDPASLENLGTPPVGSESTSPPTPPTNQPSGGAIDPKYVALLEGSLAETNRRLAQIEANNAGGGGSHQPPPPPPQLSADEQRAQFYENPMDATRRLIREELEGSVGEIRDFVRSFKGQTAIDKFVEQFKVNPRYQSMWDGTLEQYIRDQAVQVPPANLNEQTFQFIVVSAIGLKATGMLGSSPTPPAATPTPTAPVATPPAPTPAASQPSPTPSMPTPPHMRPSPPPAAPPGNNQPSHRPLNENEQRLLREYNAGKPADKQMTPAQFIKWQEMPSSEVAFTNLGQPQPPK